MDGEALDLMDHAIRRHLEIINTLTTSATEVTLTDELLEELLDEAALVRKRLMLLPIPACLETYRNLSYKQVLTWEQSFYALLNLEMEKAVRLIDESVQYAQDASEVLEQLTTDLLQQ